MILLTVLTFSCNTDKNKFIVLTDDQYKKIDEKNIIVFQVKRTLRASDSLPVSTLTKVFNYNNDTQTHYLTGLRKEDGLQDYLLDSVYYDSMGNDTLTRMFIYLNNRWQPIQIFRRKFRPDNQIVYFLSERPYQKGKYYKKETNYRYNTAGRKVIQAEFECFNESCDSIYKKEYVYNLAGHLDSTISYQWENNEWIELEKKNKNGR
jgi:hypothetical protein